MSLLMATPRPSSHACGTPDLPSASDIRAPKSAFALISSAVPPGADSQGGGAVGPYLTQSRHSPTAPEARLLTLYTKER